MLGAIIGDILGSIYESDNIKTKDFPLFKRGCVVTDDTVMTLATALGLMNGGVHESFIDAMKQLGNEFPNAGYGESFREWLRAKDSKPYNSWGNGSAMRVSPIGWLLHSIEAVEKVAEISASVTHNHPEGIKGAKAVASSIFMARKGESKSEIKKYIENEYEYNLHRTLDEIRPSYSFDVSCQGSVPEAIIAFLESMDFEDAIRNAISLGGDSDTIAAITGSIAEAAYGIPDEIRNKALEYLPPLPLRIFNHWENAYMRPIAIKDSWKNSPIIEPKEVVFRRRFNDTEYSLLIRGLIPEVMEDKWFIYFEDGWLYFHKSWTNQGLYKAQITRIDDQWGIESFFVERSPEMNINANDDLDWMIMDYLIGRGLLKKNIELREFFKENPLAAWGEFGRMITTE